jgi:AAA domain, putative AbiEii toxin, Type IV TA system
LARACVPGQARVDWVEMLERLHLKNVGPAPELEMEFAPRVNLITGDNGLGKSFLLEVGWWGLTGNFLVEIKPNTVKKNAVGEIKAVANEQHVYKSVSYNFSKQNWQGLETFIPQQEKSIVIFVGVDGKIGVFDPHRDIRADMLEPFVTSLESQQVWDGLEQNRKIISNGLIRDWATWQLENGDAFKQFKAALNTLSPHKGEKLEPGKLTRVSLNDARDIPTLKMPYGQEVPITQASAGIRRVVSLAYMLVWTWQEHLRAAELTRQEPAREIVLLIDELEQHLHPRWQRVILPALLETVKELMKSDVRVQIIATTHSPFVMASLEPLYDDTQDAWFDLNLVKGKVTLERMPWYKRGGVEDWAISEAFDLDFTGTGSVPREHALEQAVRVIDDPKVTKTKFLNADKILRAALSETDEFWVRWRFIGEKRGWL